jgi:hypothetical protein
VNLRKIAKTTNMVVIIAGLALLYWIVSLLTIKIFGLKLSDEYILKSVNGCAIILGIILFAVLIIKNIMLNLSVIEKETGGDGETKK